MMVRFIERSRYLILLGTPLGIKVTPEAIVDCAVKPVLVGPVQF